MKPKYDVVILGAGAAGLMCAARAGRGGASVLVLDHARAPGEKIRISGGGRCNFTNIHASPANFISSNRHFAKSALARYTPRDFLNLVEKHRISWHEKTLGQLFCDNSAKDIIQMLLHEMQVGRAQLKLQQTITSVEKTESGFRIALDQGTVECRSLVVATGGKSIPKMGATGFAYRLAEQFGHRIVETRPGLVPLTLDPALLEGLATLAGVAVEAEVSHAKTAFREALLFTHRGISGPAILQISSYWREGDAISLKLRPDLALLEQLKAARQSGGKQAVQTVLSDMLPRRLAAYLVEAGSFAGPMAEQNDRRLQAIADSVQNWTIRPAGSEGYRTAEVTVGGVDTKELDSRTMQSNLVNGLYFIGECVDVTGWLGGYNFQWAWASGHASGESIASILA
ncbi:NAD(P)/FAD-dependent oxidoreductase [Rhizobium helianthi]|uniref:NAD(P)/FAD-dependent oxidoreductase n=1 Tax=Rhizobium helianthi TaxID=1132695 RepID=A0ABW4M3E1_9HYPH